MVSAMGTAFEKKLEGAVRLLREFFPKNSRLYFPLIYAFLAWAVDRHRHWKKKILGWQVGPDPGWIRVKPDAFILDFFRRPELERVYRREIEAEDLDALRPVFTRLYPVLGLKDPFLTALFHEELERGDYAALTRDFDSRVEAARRDLSGRRGRSRLLRGLKTLAEEAASLAAFTLDRSDVRRMVAEIIERERTETDD